MKRIPTFKAGRHRSMRGDDLEFSDAVVEAIAESYDPALYEAPLVVGHPKLDAPAYGWVERLTVEDGQLVAVPKQVDPAFAEMVEAGRFKSRSAKFFHPDDPANPTPGQYYLKHIGFLGAQPPAVKGLRQVQFAAEDGAHDVAVEFAADAETRYAFDTVARVFRRVREWFIETQGSDTADRLVPEWELNTITEASRPAESATSATQSPAFAGSTNGDEDMSEADKARLAALETENLRLKQEASDAAAAAKAAAASARHIDHVAFAESLVQAGKLLPAKKGRAVALLDFCGGLDAEIEFAEGDSTIKTSPLQIMRDFLTAQPKVVPTGTHADAEFAEGDGAQLTAAEREVCKNLGISEKDYLATRG